MSSKVRTLLICIITMVMMFGLVIVVEASDISGDFTDPNFKQAVWEWLGNPEGSTPGVFSESDLINRAASNSTLDVSRKNISSLGGFEHFRNSNLRSFDCWENQLTILPELPVDLDSLDCSKNQLEQLPNLPGNLYELYTENNLLTQLPNLPDSLEDICCENNKLTQLPELPANLMYIYCDNNLLTQLPDLPAQQDGFQEIRCTYNYLNIWEEPLLSQLSPINNAILANAYQYRIFTDVQSLAMNADEEYSLNLNRQKSRWTDSGDGVIWEDGETVNNKDIIFSSSNPNIATVGTNGTITAISGGETTITALYKGIDAKLTRADIAVTVNNVLVTSVTLNKNSTTISKGLSETLTATVNPANATNKSVTWSSDKPAIATVDANGKVSAVAKGTATITVTTVDQGKEATCKVIVNVPVEGVTLNKNSTNIFIGASETLTATAIPNDASNPDVTWTTSDSTVASVDTDGKVTGLNEGTATIQVKTKDGNYTANCSVTVNPVLVTGISLNTTTTTINKGRTETLTATISPSNATNKSVTWNSSNTEVATVDNTGKITAIAGGETTITATTVDQNKTASCTVTVNVPVTGISLDKTSTSIYVGASESLTAIVTPTDASNKEVTWRSSDTTVANVDTTGKVTGVNPGATTIMATTKDGNYTANCSVTVNPVLVTGVGLNKTTTTINKGLTETLEATISPTNATDKEVTWKSSSTDIAIVDNNGKVTAIAKGTATITVTTVDGSKTASCTVTVNVPVTGISLDKTSASIPKGLKEKLTVTIEPEDSSNTAISWSSSNQNIVTVNNDGEVTAKALGKAIITAKIEGQTATCEVTVTEPVLMKLKITPDQLKIRAIKSEQMQAIVTLSDETTQDVTQQATWVSLDKNIAYFLEPGLLRTVSAGTVTIKTTYDTLNAQSVITVTESGTLSVSPENKTLNKNETVDLVVTISFSDGTSYNVTNDCTWKVADQSKATISGNTVTAHESGMTTINAIYEGLSAASFITIKADERNLGEPNVPGDININPGDKGTWESKESGNPGEVNIAPGDKGTWTLGDADKPGQVNVTPGSKGDWTLGDTNSPGKVNISPGSKGDWKSGDGGQPGQVNITSGSKGDWESSESGKPGEVNIKIGN